MALHRPPLKLVPHLGEILDPPLVIYPVILGFMPQMELVADLHSKILDAHPSGPIFFIFIQFSTNFVQIIGWHPL